MIAADPITAVGDALNQAGALLLPIVKQHYQDLYETEHKERMRAFQDILDGNPDHRGGDLNAFVVRLLTLAGNPPGYVSGASIEVPMEDFTALVIAVSAGVRNAGLLARLEIVDK